MLFCLIIISFLGSQDLAINEGSGERKVRFEVTFNSNDTIKSIKVLDPNCLANLDDEVSMMNIEDDVYYYNRYESVDTTNYDNDLNECSNQDNIPWYESVLNFIQYVGETSQGDRVIR